MFISLFLILPQLAFQALAQGGIVIINPTTAPLVIVNPTVAPCRCTPTANCADGAGNVNPRIINTPSTIVCPAGQIYCCNLINPTLPTAPPPPPPTTLSPATCGIRPAITNTYLPTGGQAAYAAYPWTVLIFRVLDNALIGTGILLDANTILTAAHKVAPGTQPMKVRLGEYIINAVSEPNPFLEIPVIATRLHAQYNSVNLVNDIAILKLALPVNFATTPHVKPICLPGVGSVFPGQRCWVAGFGANSFTSNQYQTVMREVDVPILDGATCQARYRATRLGANFIFNQQAFICAGGEVGRDACTGDGGAGLVCRAGNQWVLAGLVSWGLECGLTNVPGAYVNILTYLNWIAANRG